MQCAKVLQVLVLAFICLECKCLVLTETCSRDAVKLVNKKCGYMNCPEIKPNMLNVHVIANANCNENCLNMQFTPTNSHPLHPDFMNGVIQELLKDATKHFTCMDSLLFLEWLEQQTVELQMQVKMLVNEGRFEFVGATRGMSDEATAHYQSLIDQFTCDLRFLNDTFGECGRPRIGWQHASYGHSREMASMFAQMSFNGLFIEHLHYQERNKRLSNKKAEMIWHTSSNLDEAAHLFTGVLYTQYQPNPSGYSSKDFTGNFSQFYVSDLYGFLNRQREDYRSNNIMFVTSADFIRNEPGHYYHSLDKLLRYFKEGQGNESDINIFYSTPSCYLKALHDADITWPTKDGDFFPYVANSQTYCNGYFSSYPTLKRYERVRNHFMQICKQLNTLASKDSTFKDTKEAKVECNERFNHDFKNCNTNTKAVLQHLTAGKFEFKTCSLLNISQCDVSEASERFILTLYNPLAHVRHEYVRAPVDGWNYVVRDYNNVTLEMQILPIPEAVQNLTFRNSNAKYELVFLATDLPPMGYKSYYIVKSNEKRLKPAPEPKPTSSLTTIGNKYIHLTFDTNGFISAITADGMTRILNQELLYYENVIANHSSNICILHQKTGDAHTVAVRPKLTVYRGNLVDEVHQRFNRWISQVVRIYHQQKYAEFEWLVGPIPISDGIGKEIITRFKFDIKSERIFFTDSNGREMIKRLRNYPDTWDFEYIKNTEANNYPVTTKIALEDENTRMAILTDRTQGGSSMEDGSLELMVHRRLLHDAQNEVARGKHYLIFGAAKSIHSPTTQARERFTQLQQSWPVWKFFSDASKLSYDEWRTNFTNTFAGVSKELPKNIHLMSFERWRKNQILIRFEHILEKDDDPEYSKYVKFNIKKLFSGFPILDIKETTLDGNVWHDEVERMKFLPDMKNVEKITRITYLGAESEPMKNHELNRLRAEKLQNITVEAAAFSLDDVDRHDLKYIIALSPMQIRTFIIFLEEKIN